MTLLKILIAIPYSKFIEVGTFKSIYDLEVPEGYETEFHAFSGYAVDQIRNLISDRAVEHEFDYVLFVDSDITLPKDTLVKFLSQDTDIITGLYRTKFETLQFELFDFALDRLDYIPGNTFEIGGCGLGCALIKTEVLESLGYPQFQYHQSLRYEDSISEDLDFCAKARIFGYKIFCDPTITCGHIGYKEWK